MKHRIALQLFITVAVLTCALLTAQAQSCPPYEGAAKRRQLYAGAPYERQGTARLAVINGTNQPITIKLYHPDDSTPGQRPFSTTVIEPGQNSYLGPHVYGADWGIQVDQSCIRYVGLVADWNLFQGSYVFQTWPTRIHAGSGGAASHMNEPPRETGTLSGTRAAVSSVVEFNLPYVEVQNDKWSCGPNSATRLLLYYGRNVSYEMMKSTANTKRPEIMQITNMGTTPHALRDTVRVYRPETVLKRETDLDEIINALRAKKPVIALLRVGSVEIDIAVMGKGTIVGGALDKIGARPNITATYPKLHWVILHGVNQATRQLRIQNPNGDNSWVSFEEFHKKWNWSVGEGAAKRALEAEGVTTRTILY